MSEVIYVLIIAFVGYVVYTVSNDKGNGGVSTPVKPSADTQGQVVAEVSETVLVVASKVRENVGDEVKNPKTGEVSKIPNNYRFGKRWIKEALVAEGLLDKVYKNNEITDVISVNAQAAMVALKNMDKYRV